MPNPIMDLNLVRHMLKTVPIYILDYKMEPAYDNLSKTKRHNNVNNYNLHITPPSQALKVPNQTRHKFYIGGRPAPSSCPTRLVTCKQQKIQIYAH